MISLGTNFEVPFCITTLYSLCIDAFYPGKSKSWGKELGLGKIVIEINALGLNTSPLAPVTIEWVFASSGKWWIEVVDKGGKWTNKLMPLRFNTCEGLVVPKVKSGENKGKGDSSILKTECEVEKFGECFGEIDKSEDKGVREGHGTVCKG